MNFFAELLDSSVRFQKQYAKYLLNRFQFLPCPNGRRTLDALWVEPRGQTAALANTPRVVITGAAGTGKTTTLAYLAIANAHAMLTEPKPSVPIFFSGRDLVPQALPRITNLSRDLGLSNELAAQCPRIFFPDVFNSQRAIVLIDDADLIPFDQLQIWLNELKAARVIVSAQSPLADFVEYALPGFRDNDIERFARNWESETVDPFMAALKTNNVPRLLTTNPMSLTLLAKVWKLDQPLPTHRADLFEAYARGLLGESEETLKMLEGVALAIQRGRPATNEFVSKSRGFMRLAKNRTAEFTHDLWQAFFAARALRESTDITPIVEHLADANWREVILFYAGLGDADELVERLIRRGNIGLAGHVSAHACDVRSDLRESVTQELMASAWDGKADAIAALSAMQNEVAVDSFAAKLKDKDPATRIRAAQVLGNLRLDRGIEYLLPQLRDVNPDVRDQVVAALGHSRTDRVIEPLLVALRGDSRVGVVDTRMRVAAAQALGEIASDKALPALLVELQIGEPELRPVAAESLKRISSPLLVKPLAGIAQTGDDQARQYANEILQVVDGQR
ncbi:MAG: HEAT repeat domain-containing protein [Chloroflexi bacterium]|nr:HEAT repeat domain-containing protein [Chloroflexota bacterium]